MFNDKELNEYEADFNKIGITNKNEQKRVLEFLYTLGIIMYQNRTKNDKEEN
jgi:hypothetical protein